MHSTNKDRHPFFSLVIPTRNRSAILSDLLQSILDQDFPDFEIILCDNSTDENTQDILKSLRDKRLMNVRTGNLQMAENYNEGINKASGKYLMCISDKGYLHQCALSFLHELLAQKSLNCVTWPLDSFEYPGTFFKRTNQGPQRNIRSKMLLEFMLGADWKSYDDAPMHCNSCVSMDLVSSIRAKHGNLCQIQNPDYTMAAQILLATESIYRLDISLTILRNVSLIDGYGNGRSLANKTSESRQFLSDHYDWIQDTNRFSDVPIKNCPFVIDLMLKDTYKVLEDNNINPDIFMSAEQRRILYYFYSYEEIIWRKALGVNMEEERLIWEEALKEEEDKIKMRVDEEINALKNQSILSDIHYFVKSKKLTSYLLYLLRPLRKKIKGKKYKNIKDCYIDTSIKTTGGEINYGS